MLMVKQHSPVDYSKCDQTATVYHLERDKTVTRMVYPKAFLDFRKNQTIDKVGSTQVNSFLLVIPCKTCGVCVGDKVVMGIGPENIDWTQFIPTLVPEVVVVKYVDPKYWKGRMVHIEAGG